MTNFFSYLLVGVAVVGLNPPDKSVVAGGTPSAPTVQTSSDSAVHGSGHGIVKGPNTTESR